MQVILTPFALLLTAFYNFTTSYGFALILFGIVVKIILFPFALKGKRSMIQMNMVQGKMQQLQKQYANNREKLNEEITKLYAKENVSPMSGCLWSFVPILILWPLYAIIRRPLYYMMSQTSESILAIANTLGFTSTSELTTSNISSGYNELKIAGMMTAENLASAKAAAESVLEGLGDSLFALNFNFFGLDLSTVPEWKIWAFESYSWATIGLFLLPLISAGLGFAMTQVSQKTNNMNNSNKDNPMNSQMRTMLLMTPLLSLWIGFVMPAGLCLYWITNNVLSIGQELLCAKLLKKDYERLAQRRAEQERLEKEEEKRKKQEIAQRRAQAIEEAKQNKGKKPQKATKGATPTRNTAGRVGIRQYAKGRDYDPDRYGGVTPYTDPGAPIDEEAVEQALAAKGILPEEPQEETPAVVETVVEETVATEPVEEPVATEDAREEVAGEEEEVEEI